MESTSGKNWTEEDEKLLLETIDKWVENEVKPIAREYDQEDKYPHELVESMKDLGLFGATISPEYGGMGLPATVYAKVIIKVASVWMAPSGIFNSHLIMASAIERCGTDEQKTNWLPKMASGEFRGGIALTEPNAGTDLQAILTRADRNEQGYLLNGTKMWITNSMYGNCLLVLAKTDLKAKPAHKGMSAFLCQKNEGYDVSKKLKKFLSRYPKLSFMEQIVKKGGLKLIFLARLSPIFPFSILNYFYGLNKVKYRDFALGLLGIIPGTFLYCSIGSLAKSLQDLKSVQSTNNLYMTIIGVVSTFLVVYFSAKYSREYFDKSEEFNL